MKEIKLLGEGRVFGEAGDLMPGIVEINDNPDEKWYLVLLTYSSNNEDREWKILVGRQDTYDYLKNLVVAEALDLENSFILASQTTAENAGTVLGFLEAMYDQKLVNSDDFDPHEYDEEEAEEEE